MRAWDFGPFDNDTALDWLWGLEEASDTSVIAAAFERVTETGEEYLEAGECCEAIAAAEVVAALKGHPLAKLPERVKDWVDGHQDLEVQELVPTALAVRQRIRTKSELKELWDEGKGAPEWYESLDDLVRRLGR
ncbi:DUF4259 domain-containing protein [Pedosphaera parvula]|uniref:DUF4259 domain-containing protein n=1 Tax=Pedosphaera parvula (strain Ellin514) TaxID=320771 RepID=B9XAD6_PEDPL|nr:DUF4259 domain-containing protein [Pedosphaera parvula]EEF62971.1 conserved hypothetical protein [Pedosphaera parvula Ellin514]